MGFQDFESLLPNFTTQIYGCNFIFPEGAILWAESFRLARARAPLVYGQKRTGNERFLPVDRGCAFRAAISARKHARKRARKHARKPARKHGPQTCPQTFYTKVK